MLNMKMLIISINRVNTIFRIGLGLLLYGKYSIGLMVYKKINELDPNYEEAELKISIYLF